MDNEISDNSFVLWLLLFRFILLLDRSLSAWRSSLFCMCVCVGIDCMLPLLAIAAAVIIIVVVFFVPVRAIHLFFLLLMVLLLFFYNSFGSFTFHRYILNFSPHTHTLFHQHKSQQYAVYVCCRYCSVFVMCFDDLRKWRPCALSVSGCLSVCVYKHTGNSRKTEWNDEPRGYFSIEYVSFSFASDYENRQEFCLVICWVSDIMIIDWILFFALVFLCICWIWNRKYPSNEITRPFHHISICFARITHQN